MARRLRMLTGYEGALEYLRGLGVSISRPTLVRAKEDGLLAYAQPGGPGTRLHFSEAALNRYAQGKPKAGK